MKSVVHYFLKKIADYSVRVVTEKLPALPAAEILEFHSSVAPYKPTLPVNVDVLPMQLVSAFKKPVNLKSHKVYSLCNVEVSWDGVVFKNLKIFIPSLVRPEFIRRIQDTFLLRQWFGVHSTLPESEQSIAVVHDEWSVGNYYHWLVDSLPRLLVLRENYPNHLLLIPDFQPDRKTPDYISDSVRALGFNKLFLLSNRQLLRAKKVVLPELTAESLTQNPAMIQTVKNELVDALGLKNSVPHRRIYASRSTQSVRKLANEDAISEMLIEYGFETIHFEDFNFLQQIHLMQETSIFLGIHGAAMTNLMFLSSQASVIELLNEEHGDICYFRLASCCLIPYFCVPCTSESNSLLNQSNLVVDAEKLKATIELALAYQK